MAVGSAARLTERVLRWPPPLGERPSGDRRYDQQPTHERQERWRPCGGPLPTQLCPDLGSMLTAPTVFGLHDGCVSLPLHAVETAHSRPYLRVSAGDEDCGGDGGGGAVQGEDAEPSPRRE